MTIPFVLANGTGNKPDANRFMSNYDWLYALISGNKLLNGGFEQWTPGTSFSSPTDGTLIADSWAAIQSGSSAAVLAYTRESFTIDSGVYSLKVNITSGGSADALAGVTQSVSSPANLRGKSVMFGVKVNVSTANKARLKITDGTSTVYSPYHTGDGTWQLLQVPLTISATATAISVSVQIVADFVNPIYIDSAYLYIFRSTASTEAKAALDFTDQIDRSQLINYFVNVKDYGAVGDNSHDDTVPIQNAILAAEAQFGGCVIFPVGTYKITATLRVRKTVALLGLCSSLPSVDSDYSTDAGAPNLFTGGVVIRQVTHDTHGLLIQQDPVATYRAIVRIEDILFAGQLDDSGNGPGGTSGDGIRVDAGDVGLHAVCHFKNVSIAYFRGVGLNLVEGFYGSHFQGLEIGGCGLQGVYIHGTNQGEYSFYDTRLFGNGQSGTTESDMCNIYIVGGTGMSFNRISCTSGRRVQAYFKSCATIVINDMQTESFLPQGGDLVSDQRSVIFEGCNPMVTGISFGAGGGFTGKNIDMRSVTYASIRGIKFFGTVDPAGYHVYEDSSCAGNEFNYQASADSLKKHIQETSWIARGLEMRYEQRAINNTRRQAVIFQIINSGALVKHRFYDSLNFDGADISGFGAGFNSPTVTLTTSPTGTDSSTAFANGGKISSTDHTKFIFDIADIALSEMNRPMIASITYNDTGTALTARLGVSSVNVNGATRSRIYIQFYDPSGVAYDLTSIPLGKSIFVTLFGWLELYS